MPKKVAEAAAQRAASAPAVKRGHGEPVLPTFKSVLGRVVFATGIFYLMLVFVLRATPAQAIIESLILGAIMLPLYMLLDRSVHKRRLRKWQAAQDAKK